MPDRLSDERLRELRDACVFADERDMVAELLAAREHLAELHRMGEAVSEIADYEGIYRAIRSGIEHVVDWQDHWRQLTRDELIDKLMVVHRAGLNPRFSEAIVHLAVAAVKRRDSEVSDAEED